MTREEFKRRWESDEAGGGITNEDIEQCAYAWKIAKKSDGYSRPQLIALVTAAAKTADADYWAKDLPEGTHVLDCVDSDGGAKIVVPRKKKELAMSSTYNESKKKSIMKYLSEKTDDIRLRVPKGTKDVWKEYAESRGISMTKFVTDLVNEYIRDHP